MSYWRLFYHLVWTTKQREPWLTPDVEPMIYDLLRSKAVGLGATVFAVNGTEDHVHMVAAIPPKIAVATFVGQVKGVATARYNADAEQHVRWQAEYGAFTTDGKRLPYLVAYVEQQKQHHQQGTIIPVLERVEDVLSGVVLRETAPAYSTDETNWRRETLALDGQTL